MKSIFRIIALLLIFAPERSAAQNGPDKLNVSLSAEDLYSTHSTHFTGVAAGFNLRFSKILSAGAGAEYSYCGYHDDNGWNLSNLNIVPVYLSQNLYFLRLNRFEPYLRFQEGVSFIGYDKEYHDNPGPQTHLNETGFYGYGGVGSDYKFNDRLGLFVEAGLKSVHISLNNLDVNPHGITGKLGLKYAIR